MMAGSGSGQRGGKGDLNLDTAKKKFKIECKSTIRESLSIKLEWVRKITHEARMTGREPALAIMFVNDAGVPVVGGSWVAIPESLFREVFGE